jgi:hypothetical protein
LLENFNDKITTNKANLLSNNFNPNLLWLDEDVVLANTYKRYFEDLIEIFFGTELIKLCNYQYLIICNDLMKWPKSIQITCIYRQGSSVEDYMIFSMHVYNQIINFEFLNNHEPKSGHRPLTLTLNFVMQKFPIEEKFNNQRRLLLEKIILIFS